MKTNDYDYNTGSSAPKRSERSELESWGQAALTGIVFALLLIALGLLLLVLSPEAQARGDDDTLPRNGWKVQVDEVDFGTIRQRSGYIDGKRFDSQTIDLGGGITQESGHIGDRQFHCETLDLGHYTQTRCY